LEERMLLVNDVMSKYTDIIPDSPLAAAGMGRSLTIVTFAFEADTVFVISVFVYVAIGTIKDVGAGPVGPVTPGAPAGPNGVP
jgi:hypothetical protein